MPVVSNDSYVVIDPRKLAEFMRSPGGPVMRRLLEDAELVKLEAKRLVGVHRPQPGEHRARRPGTLRDSIVKRVVEMNGMPAVLIVAEDPIAMWHHEGTQPHVIEARNAPYLVFYWAKLGKVVAFKRVNHPGTKPNRFLVDALRVLAGRA